MQISRVLVKGSFINWVLIHLRNVSKQNTALFLKKTNLPGRFEGAPPLLRAAADPEEVVGVGAGDAAGGRRPGVVLPDGRVAPV